MGDRKSTGFGRTARKRRKRGKKAFGIKLNGPELAQLKDAVGEGVPNKRRKRTICEVLNGRRAGGQEGRRAGGARGGRRAEGRQAQRTKVAYV